MAKKMELQDVEVWDGSMSFSHAWRQAKIDVVAAYPITPSTPTIQNYANYLSNGYVDGEYIRVESEHAAMSGCVGASAAGGRVATATSSQGLALMVEVLYQASGMRLPVVLALVNRALASPLNVNGDHSDMYLMRDAGWINICTFNAQEAYDMMLCAFKIAETKSVRLPTVVHQDGFICSHTAQNVRPLQDDVAYEFIGDYKAVNSLLDFTKPVTYGAQSEEDWHYEHKAKQHNALMQSKTVIKETFVEFEKLTGRKYNIVEEYMMEDAKVAIVALGTTVESAIAVAKKLRKENGIKVGIVAPRMLRPFPLEEIRTALSNVEAIACLDRSAPGGTTGMLYNEVAAAIFSAGKIIPTTNYIYGLGGRDMTMVHIETIVNETNENADAKKVVGNIQRFIGLRGPSLEFYKGGE